MLFVLGSAAGLVLARVLTALLVALLPAFPIPVSVSVPLDARVVLFALGISLDGGTAVRPGAGAARVEGRRRVGLKDDVQAPLDRPRLRNAFVVAQVAFSILLVVVAAILVRAL